MKGTFAPALAIARKDLRIELRSKEVLNSAFSFSLVVLLLFSFTFDPTAEETRAIGGGLLWLVYSFAGVLVLNRSFARETINDCLDALVASPAPGAAIFLGKALANTAFLLALEIATLPVFGLFYNVRWNVSLGWLLLVLVLGTWGFTVIGTVFSALTVNVRLREVMLPVLVFPIILPALLASVRLTTVLFAGDPIAAELVWLRLLIGCDIIFTALAAALVEFVLVG
jgi:heme exporter protein B